MCMQMIIMWLSDFRKKLPPHFFSIPIDRTFHALQYGPVFMTLKGGSLDQGYRKLYFIPMKKSYFSFDFTSLARYIHLMDIFIL